MDEQLKKRLIGASVLAALAVIFVPMLLEEPEERAPLGEIPPPPPSRPFESELLREPVPGPAKVAPPLAAPPSPPGQPAGKEEEDRPVDAPAAGKPATPEAAAPRTGLPAWVVQVGSFSKEENARKLVRKLRKAGFQVLDPERIRIHGKVLYRVRVGPVLEKERAKAMLSKVNKVAGTKAKVRAYP